MVVGQVNHKWCMGAVSHTYGWLCGSVMEVVVDKHARQSQGGGGGWPHVVR